ncbi:hypothetical protein FF1_025430 [Malus domestica]
MQIVRGSPLIGSTRQSLKTKMIIDEQVDIEDEDDDAENNGDDDERKVEITPRGSVVLAALESNRIEEMEMGNQKLGLGM